jgi:hypothetical protein
MLDGSFVLDDGFVPPVISWFDLFHHWWSVMLMVVLALGSARLWLSSTQNTKRKSKLKRK